MNIERRFGQREVNADKPLIKNTLIERMFLRIANDKETTVFIRQATSKRKGAIGTATAYASQRVAPIFEALVTEAERQRSGDLEPFKQIVYRRSWARKGVR